MRTSNLAIQNLRDVIALVKGKPPIQQPYFGPNAERYLTPDYLRGKAEAEFVQASPGAARVKDGDTIVLWDGSNAGEVMKGRVGVLSSTMVRADHGSNFDGRYLFYAVKQWETFLKGQTSGSGIPHVDKEIFGNLSIIEFEPAEQTAIALMLSTMDLAIEKTEELIAKEQRVETGLMQALLTRGIDAEGNIRSLRADRFKDTQLGRIPVEWAVRSLQAVAAEEITYGIVQAGPNVEGGVPYIRTGDMMGDVIDPTQLLRTTRAIASAHDRSTVRTGDIVFALRGVVGKVLLVPPILDGVNLSRGVAKISPNQTTDATFLLWALRESGVRNRIRLQERGTTFMEITLGALRVIEIAIPTDQDEQVRIANVLASHERVVELHQLALNKLRSIRTGLMQDLLTGERCVADLVAALKVVGE